MEQAIPTQKPPARLRVFIILAIAAFFAAAVYFHALSVNDYYYYSWPWKWAPSIYVYSILLPLGIPLLAAQFLHERRRSLAIALITLSSFTLMVGGAVVEKNPPSFSQIPEVVQSRWSMGYFASAADF